MSEINNAIYSDDVHDKIRGCLIGGAAGDALGWPVEFIKLRSIKLKYGRKGIREYLLDSKSGLAEITDDTQMSLFTANGLAVGMYKAAVGTNPGAPADYAYKAYLDWLTTQCPSEKPSGICHLLDIKELHHRRAPGNSCLTALMSGKCGSIEEPINDSKGCGGIMRSAPMGLVPDSSIEWTDINAAEISAITHGHPLGYMPAAVLAHIVNRLVYGGCTVGDTLCDIVQESLIYAQKIFAGNAYLSAMLSLIDRAVVLSKATTGDETNIRALGEGWVAEETLAVAIYCVLKYRDDFSACLAAAVNHDGDSDSTGAVAGNILGAYLGYNSIPKQWKVNLELHDTTVAMADDIFLLANRQLSDELKVKYDK